MSSAGGRLASNLARPRQQTLTAFSRASWPRRRLASQAGTIKSFTGRGARMIDSSRKLEEESWPWYSTDVFYPVNIGELFPPRYQVLGKLGYGTRSTVWLCRDLRTNKYITLKVCEQNSVAARRELAAFHQLGSTSFGGPGSHFVRRLLDTFKIPRFSGDHICFVHEPLGLNIEMLRNRMPEGKLPKDVLQNVMKSILLALDFLHNEVKMIHTDIQAGNIHLRIKDDGILEAFEKRELEDPSARKAIGNDYIFESRGLAWDNAPGHPILCDFGEVRYGQQTYTEMIQPSAYRSPEVIFGVPWDSSADIWNLGVMAWHMYHNRLLFPCTDDNGQYSEQIQLASMAARMGPPPLDFLFRARHRQKYNSEVSEAASKSPVKSIEASGEYADDKERKEFSQFIKKMVQWAPERRQAAKQLLDDPWLNS